MSEATVPFPAVVLDLDFYCTCCGYVHINRRKYSCNVCKLNYCFDGWLSDLQQRQQIRYQLFSKQEMCYKCKQKKMN